VIASYLPDIIYGSTMMDHEKLLKRLHEIEEELQELRQEVEPPAKNGWKVRFEKFSDFLKSQSPLIAFTIAALTTIIAFVFFRVDPFESYRTIKTTRELSRFHSKIGDDLLFREDWQAAEFEYRTALEIDKNNIQATYGIFEAQIFQPLEGQKYFAPEVADAKLDSLEEMLPNYYLVHFLGKLYEKRTPQNYQVYFLRGTYYFLLQDYPNAQKWLTKAINLNRKFTAGYIERGYVKQSDSDIEGACKDYRTALANEKDNATANNNTGYCDLLEQNFVGAATHFWAAWDISRRLNSNINLGDAYLFAGKTKEALGWQKYALRLMEAASDVGENERFVAGEWTFNYMPVSADDQPSKHIPVKVATIKQKTIFLHYNLSFGFALNADFDAATKEFNKARQLDTHGDYNLFFEQKMKSIQYLVTMNSDVQSWFEKQEEVLAQN
jgi:tetratricopeptide (TPR) repeat protein